MAKASDVGAAAAIGTDPQAADRMATDSQAVIRTAADAVGGEPLTAQPDAADGPGTAEGTTPEPVIGPGRPPRKTQWKKGGPSPNPRGRPRKDRTLLPDVKKAFEQALNKKVSVPRGGRQVLMTRLEIGFEQLLNQFAKGDRHARRDLMGYADKLGVDLLAKSGQAIGEALTPNHQAILDGFLARRLGTAALKPAEPAPPAAKPVSPPREPALARREPASARVTPVSAQGEPSVAPLAPVLVVQERVFAPPELLDDDVAEDSSAEQEATPAVEVEPEILLPTPIPGTEYPKPPERMTQSELRAWYPEWCAKHGEDWEKQRLEKSRLESLRIRR